MKQVIQTDKAPKAIGSYSQAICAGNTVYLSGQIGLDPATGELVSEDILAQLEQVLKNLSVVAEAAGGSLADIVKLNVYLIDFSDFSVLNDVMKKHFELPFPARAAVQVSALPKGARIEVDGVMVLE